MKDFTVYVILSAIFLAIWSLGSRYLASPHAEVVSMTLKELNGGTESRGI